MRRTIGSVLTLVLALVALPVAAAPLDFTSIAGVWQNPTNGAAVAGEGTALINWGDGAAPDSGYLFEAGADILGAAVGSPLLLGTFTQVPVPEPASLLLFGGALTMVAMRLRSRQKRQASTR